MSEAKERGAVFQLELDVNRWVKTKADANFIGAYNETPWDRIYNIAKTAACDTIQNGGTFVLVRKGNTITMVQRPEEAKE